LASIYRDIEEDIDGEGDGDGEEVHREGETEIVEGIY
jgi:hypothetical protein